MDNNSNDLETGTILNIPRNFNRKIRKRKHLDALLKFRSTKKTSNDILRSSEDELFLPHKKSSITKIHSPLYYRCWYYSKRIISFSIICIFIIICIALIYSNIQLKTEVQNLSLRIDKIEKRFSNVELNNISLIIKKLQTQLEFIEYENDVKFNKTKQNSTEFYQIINNLNKKTEIELQNIINQKRKIQELKTSVEQLTSLVYNSSDKTSVILNEFQLNFDQLRNKIDQCKCSKVVNNKPMENVTDTVEQIVDRTD